MSAHSSTSILIHEKHRTTLVDPNHIVCVRGSGSYCSLQLKNGQRITVSKNLGAFARQLDGRRFFRIHQSWLVSLREITEIVTSGHCSVRLIDQRLLPVSRRKRTDLLKRIREIKSVVV